MLVEFLLARIAEDEDAAQAAFSGQMDPENGWGIDGRAVTPHVGVIHEEVQRLHVAKWNPARVLAECEAKRRIVELLDDNLQEPGYYQAVDYAMGYLAAAYADHPAFHPDWV
jgi:hypothetical protein